MPSTAPYNPTWDFGSDPQPQNKVNAEALQTQLELIAANLADLIDAVGVSIRDDNTLTDNLVVLRNLAPELSNYINTIATGTTLTNALAYYFPVRAASTANVAVLSAPQTIDGVALIAGNAVLLKNQTTGSENGIWTVNAGVWTRRSDLIAGIASGSGWAVDVSEGAVNAQTAWAILAGGSPLPVVGTNALVFFPVFASYPVTVARGGTGATTAAAARTNLACAGKATGTITGDGTATAFTITHSLGATAIAAVGVLDSAGNSVGVSWQSVSGQVNITFATAPIVAEAFTVNIIG